MSKLYTEDIAQEQAFDKGYDEGYAEGYMEGAESVKEQRINTQIADEEEKHLQELSFDGECPSCGVKLKYASVCDDEHDEVVDVAEWCPNCTYEKEY